MQKIQKQELRIPLINIPIPYGAQEEWSLNQSLCTLILKRKVLLKVVILIVEKNRFLFFSSYVHTNYLGSYFI